jgi:hypothetical protein
MDKKEERDMIVAVKPIDKTGKTGLTREKKEILKKQVGSASAPIDLNKMREWMKYENN